jgi:hypothetical protein
MLHRLFITLALPSMMQLCGNGVISYYLHIMLDNLGITDSLNQLRIKIGMTAFGLLWVLVFASLIYRFRRRTLLICGYLSMCLVYTIFTILSALNSARNFQDHSLATAAVVMIFIVSGVYHIASPVPPTYLMEINPFSLRAKAGMLYVFSTGVSSLFNGYVNPIAMAAIDWKYYIVWDSWLVVQALVVYFFFPETHGLALEEVAEVFGDALVDSEQTVDKIRELNTYQEKGNNAEHVEVVNGTE